MQNIEDLEIAVPQQGLVNSSNSCRYDAFLAFYLYSIYNSNYPDLEYDQLVIPEEILTLFITCEKLRDNGMLSEDRNNFWNFLYHKKIDKNAFGKVGFITDLFGLFNHVRDFQLNFSEQKFCLKCSFSEITKNKSFGPLIALQQQYPKQSFDELYLNLFCKKLYSCPQCKEESLSFVKTNIQEPTYLVLLHDNFQTNSPKSSYLQINSTFKNSKTGNQFSFIASINPFITGYFL